LPGAASEVANPARIADPLDHSIEHRTIERLMRQLAKEMVGIGARRIVVSALCSGFHFPAAASAERGLV